MGGHIKHIVAICRMKLSRLLILLPRDNSFYANLAKVLRDAFLREGVEVAAHCGALDMQEYVTLAKAVKPSAIFEMNRVRSEVPWLDDNIRHISWVVDLGGRDETQLAGSDITYFFDPAWLYTETGGFMDWLPPGTNTDFVAAKRSRMGGMSLAFFGHIPRPWSDEELARPFGASSSNVYTFADLLQDYYFQLRHFLSTGRLEFVNTPKKIKELALSILYSKTGVSHLDRNLEYDLLERSKRILGRTGLMEAVCTTQGVKLQIYGSENWLQWPQYSKYHHGYISLPDDLRRLMAEADLCLHEGVGMHFRSMDCMGAGGNLLYYSGSPDPAIPSKTNVSQGLHTFFERGQDYLEATDHESMVKLITDASRAPEKFAMMGDSARKKVTAAHTWSHRARKIITDVEVRL